MACRWNAVVVPALLALASVCAAQGKGALRGLRPDLVDKYKPVRGKFKCLDGSATIDFNLVNDNFCDCLDGSDEPGTSACPNGQFYCRNRGHEAKVISSAFVDDGICDCCDGSDEVGGCKNTCIEKNSKVREELHAKVDAYKAALHTRQQYSEAATAKLEAMKTRLAGIDDEIAAADNEYKRLEAEKSTVLAEEAAKAQVLADKGVPVPSPDAPLAPPPEDDEAELESHEWADEGAAGEGEPSPYDQADEGEVLAEEAEEAEEDAVPGVEEEETEEERGRRIAAQWTKDPEAAGVPVGEAGEAGAAAADQEPGAGVSDGGGADAQAAAPAVEDPDVTELLALRARLQELEVAASAAKEAAEEARADKERLARQVTYEYGPDNAWVALVGRCLEARQPQYTYKACLFDKAYQVDNNAGHSTNLGVWKGFSDGYTKALFGDGDWCHQAPKRSLTLDIQCSNEESAWGGSEPSTCAYTATVSSPAACSPAGLQVMEQQLAALLAEEEALRKEIEAEEAERAAAGGVPTKDEL